MFYLVHYAVYVYQTGNKIQAIDAKIIKKNFEESTPHVGH
jgi:hypothetical protein